MDDEQVKEALMDFELECYSIRNTVAIKAKRADLHKEIDAMQAEIHSLRSDASRYRWLRAQNWNDGKLGVVTNPKKNVRLGTFCPSQANIDAVIDAALSEESKGTT
jgi:hypothetical protein